MDTVFLASSEFLCFGYGIF